MTTPTPEERALFIGEKLFKIRVSHKSRECQWDQDPNRLSDYISKISDFIEWLSSPAGLHAVEQKMIERDYDLIIERSRWSISPWACYFHYKGKSDSMLAFSATKPEAILNAAYEALKEEEDV